MNEENTLKLFNDFPELFKYRDNMQASLMCFGFECGDGWFDLIYNLCKNIKNYFKVIPEYFFVVQVKEKFGGLRFYVSLAPEKVYDLITEAEDKSFHICERCGKETSDYRFHRDVSNWFMTLCDDCFKLRCGDGNKK